MDQLTFNLPAGAPLSLVALLLNLAVGIGLALILRWHFERFGSTLSNRGEFAHVFPFILLTTILIITVVKSSLALSLGLVGALSIVRFRTPIKEPEELAYLFLAIAIGLGLGANQRLITVSAFFTIAALLLLRRGFGNDQETQVMYLNVSSTKPTSIDLKSVARTLGEHCSAVNVMRFDETDETLEACFQVNIDSFARLDDARSALQTLGNGNPLKVSFLDTKGLL